MKKFYFLPITIQARGIKCDAPGCGFRDDSVPFREIPLWHNEPCPWCGANLLTDADKEAFYHLRIATILTNIALSPLIPFLLATQLWRRLHKKPTVDAVRISSDGTGKLTYTKKGEQ